METLTSVGLRSDLSSASLGGDAHGTMTPLILLELFNSIPYEV